MDVAKTRLQTFPHGYDVANHLSDVANVATLATIELPCVAKSRADVAKRVERALTEGGSSASRRAFVTSGRA